MSTDAAAARLRERLSGDVLTDEPMARHVSWRIGGPAAIFAVLDTLEDLSCATQILDEEEVEWTVLGKGTNVLVADEGYDGAVLVLGREFKRHVSDDESIRAGAAVMLAAAVQSAFKAGLAGLAFAVGIPGTIGGALAMNAGAHGSWIGEVVDSVTLFVPGSGLVSMKGSEVLWGYRASGLPSRGIIVEGVLRVHPEDPARIRAEMERNFAKRKETQPVGVPSAGSVFLNPEGEHAGRLIELAGLKGVRVGGARVSPVHANFIVNEGGATASDVMRLVRKIQMTVGDMYGVRLEPEIRFLGTFE